MPGWWAATSFSIFIASTMQTTSPAATSWPISTSTRRTVPCIGVATTSGAAPSREPPPAARERFAFFGAGAGAPPPPPASRSGKRSATSKRRPSTSAVKRRSARGSSSGASSPGRSGPPSPGSGVGSSDIRASRSWQAPPAMNSSCCSRKRWKGIRVFGPSTTYSSSARSMRRRADSRSTSQTISFAIIGS